MADAEALVFVDKWAVVSGGVLAEHPDQRVYLRFDLGPTGRLVIAEVLVCSPSGVVGEVVRRLALGRWEAWANDPENEWLRQVVQKETEARSPHPADEADRLFLDEFAAQLLEEGVSGHLELAADQHDAGVFARAAKRPRKRDLRLPIPSDGVTRKGDDFYGRVATAYSRAAVHGRPAVLLAEANDVPTTTIHRWVKEARRRGLMAPGERRKREER